METPPLARGRRETEKGGDFGFGNTPACAGKTQSAIFSNVRFRKHPRLRGEDGKGRSLRGLAQETPPLARGRLHRSGVCQRAVGNTPACAGKTAQKACNFTLRGKHPRLRGEDAQRERVSEKCQETPPLARGRQHPALLQAPREGNTPACAGKTASSGRAVWVVRETPPLARGRPSERGAREGNRGKHPRLRGEDPERHCKDRCKPETPPLARGRRRGRESPAAMSRNTPACAGKTRSTFRDWCEEKKHPRLRGEDLSEKVRTETEVRNTPACAGKTGESPYPESKHRKHPRLRGEDRSCSLPRLRRRETPPLARGRLLIAA